MRDEWVLGRADEYARGKRTRDFSIRPDAESLREIVSVAISLVLLVLLLPLFVMIALAISSQDRGPVLFSQERIGRNGRPFRCLKFRSMAVDAEQRLADYLACDADARQEWARDHKLKSDPRITPIGAYLRRSSLDELPQLINVIRGDMALVGPRPIVAAEVHRYGHRFRHYCRVKPGITGLWQVSGRNDVSYRRRVAMDALYARTRTLAGDALILFQTIPAVLLRKGSY